MVKEDKTTIKTLIMSVTSNTKFGRVGFVRLLNVRPKSTYRHF